jgi:arylsulfatase A
VTRLDKNVGRILAELDGLGLAGQTLLVFTSDHGATFEKGNQGASAALDSNRPFRGQKRTLWEGGVRVLAIARWPGRIPAGMVSEKVFRMTDLFSTILAVAGAVPEPSWGVDGQDVLPAWTGRADAPRRTQFWEWRDGVAGSDQIAAMEDDLNDLAAQHPEKVQRLFDALKAWLATEVPP